MIEGVPANSETSFPPSIAEVIEIRGIAPEDFSLVEHLLQFDRGLVNECLHNHFTGYKEKAARQLELLSAQSTSNEKKELYEAFLAFAQKYDHYTCHHLERVLEASR